jgi:ligand-binding SRPBCC domain-containing protein
MPTIKLTTIINAPIEICFDLSRDIDIHQQSTTKSKEIAIAGKTSGLCELNDEITWQARHFGIKQKLTVKITQMQKPYFYQDKMLKGAFKSLEHNHHFESNETQTIMKDVFGFESPLGILGVLVNKLFLTKYMTNFLKMRNQFLKEMAEKNFYKPISF